jgi:hypothetical protein
MLETIKVQLWGKDKVKEGKQNNKQKMQKPGGRGYAVRKQEKRGRM